MIVGLSSVYSRGFIGLISSEKFNVTGAHKRKKKDLICSGVCAFIFILCSCLTKILPVLVYIFSSCTHQRILPVLMLISLVKTSLYVLHAYALRVIVCCRLMPYNQLDDFPPDIFRNSTALKILYVGFISSLLQAELGSPKKIEIFYKTKWSSGRSHITIY